MRGSLCGGRNKGREGGKSAKEKRESNRPPFFSFSKSLPFWCLHYALCMRAKNENDSGLFLFLNRETLGTRVTTTSQPLTSGDIQKVVCTSYTIMIAISQQTKGKERWRSFIAVQLVRSYTEFSRETVVRLALGECILWHSYLFHNPLRSFRNSGCFYTLPLTLWAFFWVEWAYFVCIVLFSHLLLIIKHKTYSVI